MAEKFFAPIPGEMYTEKQSGQRVLVCDSRPIGLGLHTVQCMVKSPSTGHYVCSSTYSFDEDSGHWFLIKVDGLGVYPSTRTLVPQFPREVSKNE
jgi:hypothetical protein